MPGTILNACVFPSGSVVKKLPANEGDARDTGSIPGLGKSPGGGRSNSLQYFCQENPMEEEPGGYSPWGHKESDMTKRLSVHTHNQCLCIMPHLVPTTTL